MSQQNLRSTSILKGKIQIGDTIILKQKEILKLRLKVQSMFDDKVKLFCEFSQGTGWHTGETHWMNGIKRSDWEWADCNEKWSIVNKCYNVKSLYEKLNN